MARTNWLIPPPVPIATKYVQTVTVIDPDSHLEVEVEIRKLETGAMVGIDGSWLDQDIGPCYSPYDRNMRLVIPDDEVKGAEHDQH